MAHPFLGTIDTYQMLLFMNGHTLRHTLQVEEVKAHADFPKNQVALRTLLSENLQGSLLIL